MEEEIQLMEREAQKRKKEQEDRENLMKKQMKQKELREKMKLNYKKEKERIQELEMKIKRLEEQKSHDPSQSVSYDRQIEKLKLQKDRIMSEGEEALAINKRPIFGDKDEVLKNSLNDGQSDFREVDEHVSNKQRNAPDPTDLRLDLNQVQRPGIQSQANVPIQMNQNTSPGGDLQNNGLSQFSDGSRNQDRSDNRLRGSNQHAKSRLSNTPSMPKRTNTLGRTNGTDPRQTVSQNPSDTLDRSSLGQPNRRQAATGQSSNQPGTSGLSSLLINLNAI